MQGIKEALDWYFIVMLFLILLAFVGGFFFGCLFKEDQQRYKLRSQFPKCNCSNPQWCDIWCDAKQRYTQDHR